jgi:hypothetical protein
MPSSGLLSLGYAGAGVIEPRLNPSEARLGKRAENEREGIGLLKSKSLAKRLHGDIRHGE